MKKNDIWEKSSAQFSNRYIFAKDISIGQFQGTFFPYLKTNFSSKIKEIIKNTGRPESHLTNFFSYIFAISLNFINKFFLKL